MEKNFQPGEMVANHHLMPPKVTAGICTLANANKVFQLKKVTGSIKFYCKLTNIAWRIHRSCYACHR